MIRTPDAPLWGRHFFKGSYMATLINKTQDKARSGENRSRYIRKYSESLKQAIDKAEDSSTGGFASGEVLVGHLLDEPSFRYEYSPNDFLVFRNYAFSLGDEILMEKQGEASGGGQGGFEDGGEQAIRLTDDEFTQLVLADLELPALAKKRLNPDELITVREGFTCSGAPANLSVIRSYKNSFGRRAAFKAGIKKHISDLQMGEQTDDTKQQIAVLEDRMKKVPYFDDIDLRFANFGKHETETYSAVVFFILDVSGSMGTYERDIARRFFYMLNLLLKKQYGKVEKVFIVHTEDAKEVSEQNFFESSESGGTDFNAAYDLVLKKIHESYPAHEWNIYTAHASDSGCFNMTGFAKYWASKKIPELLQYGVYLDVTLDTYQEWKEISKIMTADNVTVQKCGSRKEILSLFKKLFKKRSSE